MVWPIVKIVGQLFGSVVGRSVVAAWKQVSAEAGNKDVFRHEIQKAWSRHAASRAERSRLHKVSKENPVQDNTIWGTDADSAMFNADAERVRESINQARKARPDLDAARASTISTFKQMPPAEAVKVLSVSEPSEKAIEERFKILMQANGEEGSSQYIHDKIIHARDVCLSQLKNGTLKNFIKKKKEDPKPTDL